MSYEQGHKAGKLSRNIGVYENCFEGIEKYCGVKIERISDFKFEELFAFIKENLKRNMTTLLHTDTYYLPWNKTFLEKTTQLIYHRFVDMMRKRTNLLLQIRIFQIRYFI